MIVRSNRAGTSIRRMMPDGSGTGPENRGRPKGRGDRHLRPAPYALLAQLVEQRIFNPKVVGSSPSWRTTSKQGRKVMRRHKHRHINRRPCFPFRSRPAGTGLTSDHPSDLDLNCPGVPNQDCRFCISSSPFYALKVQIIIGLCVHRMVKLQ